MPLIVGRRAFVVTGLAALAGSKATAQSVPESIASGDIIGRGKMLIVIDDPVHRILAFDSSAYFENNETSVNDVVAFGSYCGTRVLSPVFSRGVKAIIATDAGIGKDEAGISGLKHAALIGVPVAAINTMSADTSNGRSTLLGEISRANAHAVALGVVPGQPAWQAALLLSKAPPGRAIPTSPGAEEAPQVVETTPKGRVWVAGGTTAIKQKIPNDIVCSGSNSSRVMSDGVLRMGAAGAIANDAGIGRNNSAVEGLFLLAQRGIPAASVSTMSARIGEGSSTWNDGTISIANESATKVGVKPGMSAKDAARLMLSSG
jgi:hypothetical protein